MKDRGDVAADRSWSIDDRRISGRRNSVGLAKACPAPHPETGMEDTTAVLAKTKQELP